MNRRQIVRELNQILGRDYVIWEPDELLVYECDANPLDKGQPTVVVLPATTEEVVEIVKLANRHKLPFLARGAGTCLSGGTALETGGILIQMSRMNRVLDVDYENRVATVQPGLVNVRLNDTVAHANLHYAPDPSSQIACTIGGNVAENAGGPHTLKYGVTTNHVLGLEFVSPQGDVFEIGGKNHDVPGLDLTGLFVGSEGTFGVVTKVYVRLMGTPEAFKTLLVVFDNVRDATNTVSGIIGHGIIPAALEMMDRLFTRAVESYTHAGFPEDAEAVLIIELDGIRDGMDEMAAEIERICNENNAREVRIAKDNDERMLLWKARKAAFGAIGKISPCYYTHDGVIPRSKLPEVLDKITRIAKKHDVVVANVFHAGDGNLHPVIMYDPRDPELLSRALKAGKEAMRVVIDAGGTLSGEHGIGIEKRELMPWLFSEDDLSVMRQVRDVFNPDGLCNPGKIFPTEGQSGEMIMTPAPSRAAAGLSH